MARSREVGLPFLDRRVAESRSRGRPRACTVRAASGSGSFATPGRGVVPAAILERRDKVGFEPPQAPLACRARPARERASEVLLDGEARSRGLYDTAAVEARSRAGSMAR